MGTIVETLAELRDAHAFGLSDRADCYSPDSADSAGALFLSRVRDDVLERLEYVTTDDGVDIRSAAESLRDDAHEIADTAVPIYTAERWRAFVDLGAYNEDVRELGDDASDLTQTAAVALYMIAERLVSAILQEIAEADDDDDAETAGQ